MCPTEYIEISQAIEQAAQEASNTPQHPEVKLRELVEMVWNKAIRDNRNGSQKMMQNRGNYAKVK